MRVFMNNESVIKRAISFWVGVVEEVHREDSSTTISRLLEVSIVLPSSCRG